MSGGQTGVLVFLSLATLVLLFVGLVYAAKYKGRSPLWALLAMFMIFGVFIFAAIKDCLGERLIELKAQLQGMGEEV
jgi:hypothetical protein